MLRRRRENGLLACTCIPLMKATLVVARCRRAACKGNVDLKRESISGQRETKFLFESLCNKRREGEQNSRMHLAGSFCLSEDFMPKRTMQKLASHLFRHPGCASHTGIIVRWLARLLMNSLSASIR